MIEKSLISSLTQVDPQVCGMMEGELARQRDGLELIASENFVPLSILQAQGSVLTNKYAEGYPHKKYYGGCEFVENIEELAIKRACELLAPSMQTFSRIRERRQYGCLFFSHGTRRYAFSHELRPWWPSFSWAPSNFTGKWYKIVPYGVKPDTETIDYDAVEALAKEHKPKVIVAGASAYPRFIDFERFQNIAREVDAILMVDMAHIAGLVAGGAHPSPVPYADFVTTTTHKTLRGPRGALILCKENYGAQLDRTVFPGTQGGPFMHVIAAKATCFKLAMQPEFKEYAKQVVANAKALAKGLGERGFRLVSGGTDNHMMLVDLRSKNITGKEAEKVLESVGITVNKNMIPFDPEKAMITSGIRIGTPALTTRGMKEKEMEIVAELIDRALSHPDDEVEKERVRKEVKELVHFFPLYPELSNPWG